MPAVSPYANPFADAAPAELRRMLEARVDFDALPGEDGDPLLLIGAVDVLSGDFKAFNSRRDRISVETILASAAIPTLFRSVHLDGGTYWDGLFSQNPPVRELVDAQPDEIWVIQINPRRLDYRAALGDRDRRPAQRAVGQPLPAPGAALHREDRPAARGGRARPGRALPHDRRPRHRALARSAARRAGPVSKLNRDPAFIAGLIAHGEERAAEFLAALAFERAWTAGDVEAALGFFADDARLASEAPFPRRDAVSGKPAIRRFLGEHLAGGVAIDVTHKQVAGDRVTWSARWHPRGSAERTRGEIAATFRGERITRLTLAGVA